MTTGWNSFYSLGDTESFVVPSPVPDPADMTILARCQLVPGQTQTMHPLNAATGGVLTARQDVNGNHRPLPLICGGLSMTGPNDKCYSWQVLAAMPPSVVVEVGVMRELRSGAASVAILHGQVLWITGGVYHQVTDTTEWIDVLTVLSAIDNPDNADNKPESTLSEGILLPEPMAYHCLEMVNSDTAILIGGRYLTRTF